MNLIPTCLVYVWFTAQAIYFHETPIVFYDSLDICMKSASTLEKALVKLQPSHGPLARVCMCMDKETAEKAGILGWKEAKKIEGENT
jgi:hypothetical protein